MSKLTRRHFLRTSAATAAALAGLPNAMVAETQRPGRSATDWVTLGKSGLKVTRLGFGTGTNGGEVQRSLGQKEFTRLVRHAYERGIRFFDTSGNYDQMHEMLVKALEGVDRGTYAMQTKMEWPNDPNPWDDINRFRKELRTDYLDSFLLHAVSTGDWADKLKRQMDIISEAKQKQVIRAKGVSVHGLLPLRATSESGWADVSLLRVNHNGLFMDNLVEKWAGQADVNECVTNIRKIHRSGSGVIGMKLIGNGDFTDPAQRDASIKFVMGLDCVDAVVIGFKSPAEVDEVIDSMNKHLSA
jgi:predicted aldo/keto reductase-like oxidoreductase